MALKLQQVYAHGWLVTVDETMRIKPLAIPVKATLLGQQSERTVGALTHKQSFSLQVLDEAVAKEVEKCRRVTDLMDLLNSKAVHHAYSKHAEVTVPSLDDWEKQWKKNPHGMKQPKVVAVDFQSSLDVRAFKGEL